MARDADDFVFVSVFLSHPSVSESHPFSSAVSEEVQSSLVEAAVKNHGSIKMMYSIPCLCCFSSLELSCSIWLSPGVLQLYQMWVQNPLNLASPLCSVPESGYLVAGKSSDLNKASWDFCLFLLLFPTDVFCPGLSRDWEAGDERPCFSWRFLGSSCIFCILELKSSAPLCISGAWYIQPLPVSCAAGRLIQFTGGTVMPLVNASGKQQQVICNLEKVTVAFSPAAHLAGGQHTGNHHPELLLGFLALLRVTWGGAQLPGRKNDFKWVVFRYCKHFLSVLENHKIAIMQHYWKAKLIRNCVLIEKISHSKPVTLLRRNKM